ncbi:hypothetical protein FACS1894163_08290 [Spirochaetia bacterium]|nr:hypothetical protein FACS1894163_08290 [Spirochaetia bacterium]
MRETKRQRSALWLLLAAAVLILVGGCSKAKTASSSAEDSSTGPLEIHAMLMQYQQPPDPNGAFWKDMESKYNIKYTADWVQDGSYSEKLALVLSSNDLPDIVQIANTTEASVIKAIEAGQFKDLSPYLDFNKYPNMGKVSSSAWINSRYKGKNYVFPRSRGQYNDSIMLRGDILKKYNLPTPRTLAEFEAYLAAAAKEGGIPMPQVSVTRFQPMFGPGNIKPVFTADGTGIVPQHLTESYALAVEYLAGLYAKGWIAKEYAMFNDAQAENALISGKSGMYYKNVWHRFRLNQEIHKTLPDAEVIPIFSLEGPGGIGIMYDKGFYGGIMVNAKLSESKMLKLMDFFEETCKAENYFYFTYGLEGRYYNLVDGFPQLTEEGKKDVNNSFYCPYMLATDMFNKVDSPLAPPAYNRETRELVKVIDGVAAGLGYAPFTFFDIISSAAYANFWALNSLDFDSNVADVITGKRPISDFRAYQQRLLQDPLVQTAQKEYKASWDEFGLANWKAPAL